MHVTGKLALSCRSSVIYWMKSLLFSISRGVYTNVPAFRYDLGEILIIMNDKKNYSTKMLIWYLTKCAAYCHFMTILHARVLFPASHHILLIKTKTVYLSVTSWFFSLLTIFFQNSFRFESINKFYVNLEQRQVI